MYCRNCGKEIDDKAVICVHCGVATDNMFGARFNTKPAAPQEPAKPINVLAIVGLVVSGIGLFGGNYLFMVPGIVGLILSIIGMVKAKKYSYGGLAIAALVVSIAALAIWAMIWGIAFAIIIADYGWSHGGIYTALPFVY